MNWTGPGTAAHWVAAYLGVFVILEVMADTEAAELAAALAVTIAMSATLVLGGQALSRLGYGSGS